MEDSYFENELDALRYVYEGDAIETEGEDLHNVEVVIRPYLDSTSAARVELCQARLRLSFRPDDPNSTTISLVETKGMEDDVARTLSLRLDAELRELCGAPALFSHLCETARQHATAANRPAGHCAVCLGDLEEGDPSLSKLEPCWHLFHAPCLARLALWRAEEVAEVAREKAENLGRPLKPSSLPGPTAVSLSCPVCRVAFTPDQVPGLIDTIKEVASGEGSGRPGAAQPALREAPVPESLRSGLDQLQRRFERILRVQRDAGGLYEKKSYLIDESTRVAVAVPQGNRSSRDGSPILNAAAGTGGAPRQERDRSAGRAPPPPQLAKPSGSEDAASASAPPLRPRGSQQVVVVVPGTSGPAPAEASRVQARQQGAEGTEGSRKPRQPSGRGRGSDAGGAGRGAAARPAPDPSSGSSGKGDGEKSEPTKGRARGRRPETGGPGSGKAGPGSKRDTDSAPAAGASLSGRLRGDRGGTGPGPGGSTNGPAAGGQAGIPQLEATAAGGAGR